MNREFTVADMRESMKAFSLDSPAMVEEPRVESPERSDEDDLSIQEENQMDLDVAFRWMYLRANSLMQENIESLKAQATEYDNKSKNIKIGSSERMALSDRAEGIRISLSRFGDNFTEAASRISRATESERMNLTPEQARIYFQVTRKQAQVTVGSPAVALDVKTAKAPAQDASTILENTRRAQAFFSGEKK